MNKKKDNKELDKKIKRFGTFQINEAMNIFFKDKKVKKYLSNIFTIQKNWKEIIGEKYYKYCELKKITHKKNNNAILYITCFNNSSSFYIQNNKIKILELINMYLGNSEINDIKIFQNPKIITFEEKKVKENLLENEEIDIFKIENMTKDIKDKELKKSVISLLKNMKIHKYF